MAEFHHISVLPAEVMSLLSPRPGGIYLDGTLGGAGHATLILEASAPDGVLIGFDRDEEALAAAGQRLAKYGARVHLFHGNFAEAAGRLSEAGVTALDGFLLDLGVSSHQLDQDERGFSFQT